MDLDPDDATLFSNRSLCWLRRGHGGKALLDAHECRKKQPDWSKACYRLGASLMSLKVRTWELSFLALCCKLLF